MLLDLFGDLPFTPMAAHQTFRGVTSVITLPRPTATKVLIVSMNGAGFRFTIDGTTPLAASVPGGALGFPVPLDELSVGLASQKSKLMQSPAIILNIGAGAVVKLCQLDANPVALFGGAVDLDIQWGV